MSIMQSLRSRFRKEATEPVEPEHPDWHWTNDQWVLEQYLTQLLFVPDAMKEGGKFHEDLLARTYDEKCHNPSCYTDKQFHAYKRDMQEHSDAIILPGDFKASNFVFNPPEASRIQGELYSVKAGELYLLDKLRLNGVQFIRQRVKIMYPFRYVTYSKKNPNPEISPHGFKTCVAWMYVGLPSYWDPLIGGVLCKPLNLFEHDPPRLWIGKYFRFDP